MDVVKTTSMAENSYCWNDRTKTETGVLIWRHRKERKLKTLSYKFYVTYVQRLQQQKSSPHLPPTIGQNVDSNFNCAIHIYWHTNYFNSHFKDFVVTVSLEALIQ
jgi:hypothetical protein